MVSDRQHGFQMNKTKTLQNRLKDKRSNKVIFLSHCILNENTRYLGGACKGGCVTEIVEQCLSSNIGIVQMPCPEQQAWGGVIKRWFLMVYGIKDTFVYQMRGLLLPLFICYTKIIYRRLARITANQVKDYLVSDYSVTGVMGIDGSPSCGVNTTLNMVKSFELTANLNVKTVTVEQMNTLIQQCLMDGRGIFTAMLQEELKKRRIVLPYQSHDLIAEINGLPQKPLILI
jgi:predicted secreted protein